MRRTVLGDLEVSVLGLGTSRLASLGARHSMAHVETLLDRASAMGINLLDTSDSYGSGACERTLGRALRARKGLFRIATKGGLTVVDLPIPLRPLNQISKAALRAMGRTHKLTPQVIRRRIDASLRRLQVETIDLYFLHDPPLWALSDELFGTLERVIHSGKVHQLGISTDDADVLERALGTTMVRVVQTRVSPAKPGPYESWARSGQLSDMSFLANQVLARGELDDELEREIAQCAEQRGLTRAGILIRHAAAQPRIAAVLVGTTNIDHLKEAVDSLTEVPMPEDRLNGATYERGDNGN